MIWPKIHKKVSGKISSSSFEGINSYMHDLYSNKNCGHDHNQFAQEKDKTSHRVQSCNPENIIGQCHKSLSSSIAKISSING